MSKQSTIQIHDAKNKGAMGYRVKFVGKNSEILTTSEVLESVAAVNKNIIASVNCGATDVCRGFRHLYMLWLVQDHTALQKFIRYGAKSGLKVKPKAKAKK